MFLPIPCISDFNGFPGMKCSVCSDFSAEMNRKMIHPDNLIPFLKTCLFCGISFHYPGKNGLIISHAAHQDKRENKCKNKIKKRSCKYDAHTSPYRLFTKCTIVRRIFVFPFHHAGSSKRKCLNAVFGFAFLYPTDSRSKAETKFIYPDSVCLCKQKMPQFMK